MATREDIIEQWKTDFRLALADEWAKQGHQMNDSQMESIEFEVSETFTQLAMVINVFGAKYLKYINEGVPASRIPFSEGSGKKSSLFIDALQKYVMKRMGKSEKEAKGIAFAIAKTQKKEGMSTKGAYAFSSTGKRHGFIEATLDRDNILSSINDLYSSKIELEIDIIVKEGNNGNNN